MNEMCKINEDQDWSIFYDGEERKAIYRYTSEKSSSIFLGQIYLHKRNQLRFFDYGKICGDDSWGTFLLEIDNLDDGKYIILNDEMYELLGTAKTFDEIKLKYPEYFI